MFTIFDQTKFLACKFDAETEAITIWLEGKAEPIHIHKDDELYDFNLAEINKIKNDILAKG